MIKRNIRICFTKIIMLENPLYLISLTIIKKNLDACTHLQRFSDNTYEDKNCLQWIIFFFFKLLNLFRQHRLFKGEILYTTR